MRAMMMAAVSAAFALGSLTGAQALTSLPQPAPMKVAGTLTCNVAPGIGLGFASSRPATCIFDHIGAQGFSEQYQALFARVGLDVGFMGSQSVKFTVLTPDGAATPGQLAGSHLGASSEAAFIKASGVRAAFGTGATPVVLQQSSESSWVGLGFGSGDTTLDLSAPTAL
jgi:hypothetical protein